MKTNLNSTLVTASVLCVCALVSNGCAGSRHEGSSHPPTAAATAPAASVAIPATTPTAAPVVAPAVAPAAPAASIKVALKVVRVDSEETAGENGKGVNAVDGDPNSFWHTQWQDAAPECPHEIVIELAPAATIKGFTYLPRQDESENGTIKGYEFYVSNDGQNFGQPVAKGELENSKTLKTVTCTPVPARFIKLKALSEANDGVWTSAAEIGVVAE